MALWMLTSRSSFRSRRNSRAQLVTAQPTAPSLLLRSAQSKSAPATTVRLSQPGHQDEDEKEQEDEEEVDYNYENDDEDMYW